MSNNQSESLENRLAKRRLMRTKRFADKNSVDESEIKLINQSPTTRSLDRQSSKRINSIVNNQSESSSTITKNPELPPLDNSYSKQNQLLSNNKTNSTPSLPQVTKHQSFESENGKQSSPKATDIHPQQHKPSHQDEKPVATRSPTEKSNRMQSYDPEQTKTYHNEKPMSTKETVATRLPTEKSNGMQSNKPEQTKTYHDEKPVTTKETVGRLSPTEKSNIIQSNPHEQAKTYQDEKHMIAKTTISPVHIPEKPTSIPEEIDKKPVIIKEMVAPILSPPTAIEKPKLVTRESSLPNRDKRFSRPSEPIHPSSHPQSTTGRQDNHFNFPFFHSKPIARTTSEQIVSSTNYKHEPIIPILAQPDSLALSYLFNKRIINGESAHTTLLNNPPSQRKTVWD